MKRVGPSTEPGSLGIPVASRVGDDLQSEHETVKVLSNRYEENKERWNRVMSGVQIFCLKNKSKTVRK